MQYCFMSVLTCSYVNEICTVLKPPHVGKCKLLSYSLLYLLCHIVCVPTNLRTKNSTICFHKCYLLFLILNRTSCNLV